MMRMPSLDKLLGKISVQSPIQPDFWEEWKDDSSMLFLASAISMMLLMVLYMIVTMPSELQRAQIFTNMLLAAIAIMGLDIIGDVFFHKRFNTIFQWVGFGGNFSQAGLAILFGTLIGFAAFPSVGAISTPLAATELVVNPIWIFVYVVLLAPFVEETFFRGTVLPTFASIFRGLRINAWNAGVAACVIQATAFGYMHWVAYGADSNGIVAAMLMGTFCGVGNYIFRSTLFGISLHVVNNFVVAFMRPGGI